MYSLFFHQITGVTYGIFYIQLRTVKKMWLKKVLNDVSLSEILCLNIVLYYFIRFPHSLSHLMLTSTFFYLQLYTVTCNFYDLTLINNSHNK